MTLLTATTDVNTDTLPSKIFSQEGGKPTAHVGTVWQSLAKYFWAYTEEAGKAETKSFEGLL